MPKRSFPADLLLASLVLACLPAATPVRATSPSPAHPTAKASVAEGPVKPKVVLIDGQGRVTVRHVAPRLAEAPSLTVNDYGISAPPVRLTTKPHGSRASWVRVSELPGASAPTRPGRTALPGLPSQLTVGVGKFIVVRAAGLKSVVVADPKVADVVVLSTQLVLLTGKAPGETQVFLRDTTGITEHTVIVKGVPRAAVEDVQKALRVPGVKVSLIKDALILEGTVPDTASSDRAQQIAKLFNDKVINLLTVKQPVAPPESPELAAAITKALGLPGVGVRVTKDTAVLSGTVDSPEQKAKAEQVAAIYVPNVVSLLKLKPLSPEEIEQLIGNKNVHVRVVRQWVVLEGRVETDAEKQEAEQLAKLSGLQVRNQLKLPPKEVADQALAAQIQQVLDTPTVQVSVTSGNVVLTGTVSSDDEGKRLTQLAQLFSPNVKAVLEVTQPPQVQVDVKILEINTNDLDQLGMTYPQSYLFGENEVNGPIVRQTPVTMNIEALIQENRGRVLSKPSTTVLSGKEAKFNVGGEIPIPVSNESTGGGVLSKTVEFRQYGIILTVTPTVDRQGNITLKLQTEVSAPDPTTAVQIDNSLIPGFKTRSSETEVFVKDGQTLVIAGLIDHSLQKNVTKFPILGDIPILGNLFRSVHYQRGETELVILVSPHRV